MRHWRRRSMKLKGTVAVVVGLLILVGGAYAQDAKPAQPTGVKSRGLVGSTGAIASVAGSGPAALSGQVVELAPGGQSGKQKNLAPSFIYVLEGTLVIETEGGPIGVSGIQYHRSEEHTSELQSPCNLVCRLLLEKKKKKKRDISCNIP